MEIQLTADENAAWSIYILMIVRMFFKVIELFIVGNIECQFLYANVLS